MGYIVYFNPAFFEAPVVEKQRNLEQFYGYDDEHSIRSLLELFEKDKVFLRPRLTIEEISHEIGFPSRYISYLINHILQSNFNQFVNTYRVKEVLKRLEDTQNDIKTLLGIALDSGFSSKSAFRSVTGEPPSTFLKPKGQPRI
jgi:AraC-like DNA-binding protein